MGMDARGYIPACIPICAIHIGEERATNTMSTRKGVVEYNGERFVALRDKNGELLREWIEPIPYITDTQRELAKTHRFVMIVYVVNEHDLLIDGKIFGQYKTKDEAIHAVKGWFGMGGEMSWSKDRMRFNMHDDLEGVVRCGEVKQSMEFQDGAHLVSFMRGS
jgi:hypothetical protein